VSAFPWTDCPVSTGLGVRIQWNTQRLTGNAVAGNLLERYERTGDLAIASAIAELISVRMGPVPPEPKRVTDLLGDLLERIQTKC